jgi:hypothetical protein
MPSLPYLAFHFSDPSRENCKVRGLVHVFGEKTHFVGKRLPENMDLSPSIWDFACLMEFIPH